MKERMKSLLTQLQDMIDGRSPTLTNATCRQCGGVVEFRGSLAASNKLGLTVACKNCGIMHLDGVGTWVGWEVLEATTLPQPTALVRSKEEVKRLRRELRERRNQRAQREGADTREK
jgi:hypothetical protein